MLSGCSKEPAAVETGDGSFTPETTAIPSYTETAAVFATDAPLPRVLDVMLAEELGEEPESPEEDVQPGSDEEESSVSEDVQLDPADLAVNDEQDEISFTYEKLKDTSFGFNFAYPIGWENLPGKHTVCYREADASGYPARVSVTVKSVFAHNPKDDVMQKQFMSFIETVYKQYDPDTFELDTPSTDTAFMGKTGLSVSYLAYDGEYEVYGYACCAGIGKEMYVFHFVCDYEDSEALKPAMRRMRDSVTPVE